jgi:hypothetical protein
MPGRAVLRIDRMRARVAEDDRLAVLADFIAQRGFELEIAAGLQPEIEPVEHGAGRPAHFGHACDRGEAHAGDLGDGPEDARHGVDPLDRCEIVVGR